MFVGTVLALLEPSRRPGGRSETVRRAQRHHAERRWGLVALRAHHLRTRLGVVSPASASRFVSDYLRGGVVDVGRVGGHRRRSQSALRVRYRVTANTAAATTAATSIGSGSVLRYSPGVGGW